MFGSIALFLGYRILRLLVFSKRRGFRQTKARTPNECVQLGEQHRPVPQNPLGLGGTVA
jgi:hypothetical protein